MNNRHINQTQKYELPIWVQVVKAAQAVDHRIDGALSVVDLSRAKLAVLHHLVETGEPISLTKLAGLLSCVKSNITNLIDRLESDGLVERVNDDQDRRTILVRVTKDGRRLYNQGMSIVNKEEEQLLKDLSEQEREKLAQLLTRLR